MRIPIFVLASLFLAIPCEAEIFIVDDDGPADFNNIQAAIDDSNDGDVIVVLPGTYTGGGNRDIDFGGRAVTVTSVAPEDSYIVAATVIDCNGTEEDAHRGFCFQNGEDENSVLAGLTIMNGLATGGMYSAGGGGIACNGSSPTISHCRIVGNTGEFASGGGIWFGQNSQAVIENCEISGNGTWGDGFGGGICCSESSPTIANCTITGNSSEGCGSGGGGICCLGGGPVISRCTIMGNRALDRSGGGILCRQGSDVTIMNCKVVGNGPDGIGGWGGRATIAGCTIADNSWAGVSSEFESSLTITDCILWGNACPGEFKSSLTITDCILWGDACGEECYPQIYTYDGTVAVSYSDVQGGEEGVWVDYGSALDWGQGNIDLDPCFVSCGYWDFNDLYNPYDDSWVDGDYHPLGDSPCINAGDPDYLKQSEEQDLDGNPRIMGGRIDMGAYESYEESAYLRVSEDSFFFVALKDELDPCDQVLQIFNGGTGSFAWQISEDCAWLEAAPMSGEVGGEVDDVTLAVDANGLDVGKYVCQLGVSSGQAADSPQAVDVVLYVCINDETLFVPFEYGSIQDAIDDANEGDRIVVTPGIYNERIVNSWGKNIILTSIDPNYLPAVEGTVIHGDGEGSVVEFTGMEGPSCRLDGFTISGGAGSEGGGICGHDCLATIANCVITDNRADLGGGLALCRGLITRCTISYNSAESDSGGLMCFSASVSNCTIVGNWGEYAAGGLYIGQGHVSNCTIVGNSTAGVGGGIISSEAIIANCIIWGNSAEGPGDQFWETDKITYSCVQGGAVGLGNIGADPCLVDSDGGDYHLKSKGWRWHKEREVWTWDDVTSRCIDAGNPGSVLGEEPLTIPRDPNNLWGQNLRINMGAYGGTAEASMPPYDWALLADLTNDGIVDGEDFAHQAKDWQESDDEQPGDLNRDGVVDMKDAALLVDDWVKTASWH